MCKRDLSQNKCFPYNQINMKIIIHVGIERGMKIIIKFNVKQNP